MNFRPSAVFFDFDGVIVNSEPLHFSAIRDVLKLENIDLAEQEYYRELIGFDDRGAFGHMLSKHGRSIDAQTMERVVTRKATVSHAKIAAGEFSALPGVDEFVRGIAAQYPLAICSGAMRHEIEPMLDAIQLRDFFPIIVSAEDVKQGKPHPEGYLLTLELMRKRTGLDLSPADCLIIEDAPTVIRSVNAQGFKTLGVATSYPIEALEHATYRVSSLLPAEILQQIPGLKLNGLNETQLSTVHSKVGK